MTIFLNLVNWVNNNQGLTNTFLSVVSLLLAFIAIGISISTNRKQVRLQLFNERYTIFERFLILKEIMEPIVDEAFTYKGFIMIANTQFYLGKNYNNQNEQSFYNHFSSTCGSKVIKYNIKLEQLAEDSEEYKAIVEERSAAVDENFFELYNIYEHDRRLLTKSRLFFPDIAVSQIAKFLAFYKTLVFALNYTSEEHIQEIRLLGRELLKEIDEAKVINIMDEYLDFTKI